MKESPDDYLICYNGCYYDIDRATSTVIFISNKKKGMCGLWRKDVTRSMLIKKATSVLEYNKVKLTV